MTFLSYAQNFEDVLLWRALKDHGPGFYIDVGAADPVAESVTKAFYEAGWRGINIEPMAEPFALLRADRPRDVNLQLAVEDVSGSKQYFSIDGGNGLSTGIEEYADGYRRRNWDVRPVVVEDDTLANICREYVDDRIHFVKIDVEGMEFAVLAGADFERFRPWVLVVECESTCADLVAGSRRQEQTDDHEKWEPLVLAAEYRFVFFDGLNRYYVTAEKEAVLGPRLSVPANVFDNFERAVDVRAREALESERLAALEWLEEARGQLRDKDVALDALESERLAALEWLEEARGQLRDKDVELDVAYQEIFEGSRHTSALAARVQRTVDELALQSRRLHAAEAQADKLQAVLATKAWRATRPLRWIRGLFRR